MFRSHPYTSRLIVGKIFQQIPYGLTLGQASGILFAAFTIGALANTGRAILMRMAGQRIVARLRERTYAAALGQEVEFVERGEGDVLSRLSVDSSIVGERCKCITPSGSQLTPFRQCDTKPIRWSTGGRYGFRWS